MANVRLVATGSYLPGDPISNEEIEGLAGPVPEDVLQGLQVNTRHWSADARTGEHLISNSEMAHKAVAEALDLAEVEAEEVDLLLVSTASPEYHLPPTATLVQEKLGLRRCATIDIRSGCAGAVEAMDVARLYLERGVYETAVVVGSEAISPLIVPIWLGRDAKRVRMRDRLGVYSFGDGAGAMVLKADAAEGDGICGSAIACVGGGREPGMQVVGGGTHRPIHEQLAADRLVELKVDVVETGRFLPHVVIEALRETLGRSATSADAIDMCVLPEGNAGYMTDHLLKAGLLTPEWQALEGKIFENLRLVGATGSAAVPLAIDYAWKTGRVRQGQTVMLLAIETSKWKYGGIVLPWTAKTVPAGKRGLSQAA